MRRYPFNGYVTIVSNGCVPSRLEAKKLEEIALSSGWEISPDPSRAELIIFNTCGYSGDKITETVKMLRYYAEHKKGTCELVMSGCLPKINREAVGNEQPVKCLTLSDIRELLRSKEELSHLYVSDNLIDILEMTRHDIFHIITSTGCLGKCTYCAIKFARGTITSKPINVITSELTKAMGQGFKKFLLWGDDLGAYGADIGTNFIKLLSAMITAMGNNGNRTLYLTRLNPQWAIMYFNDLMDLLNTNRIGMIMMPIQSGSDRILRLMDRNYAISDVKAIIKKINNQYPSLSLRTDLMVGFPSETDGDFQETLSLVEELNFDEVNIFKYSGVPNTVAYGLGEQVDESTKKERAHRLNSRVARSDITLEIEHGCYWAKDSKGNIRSGPFCPVCHVQGLSSRLVFRRTLEPQAYLCPDCGYITQGPSDAHRNEQK